MSDPITLTDAEMETIADAAARAHGRGRFDPLWAAVHDLIAARLAEVTAERKLWYDRAGDVLAALRNAEAERDALRDTLAIVRAEHEKTRTTLDLTRIDRDRLLRIVGAVEDLAGERDNDEALDAALAGGA